MKDLPITTITMEPDHAGDVLWTFICCFACIGLISVITALAFCAGWLVRWLS